MTIGSFGKRLYSNVMEALVAVSIHAKARFLSINGCMLL